MKKSLVALAALAATSVFAQSSVTISGLIDSGFASVNGPATNGDIKGLRANNTATTVLTLAGTEDLGGGLKANFQFQLTPDFLTGNGVQGGTANNTGGDGAYTTAIGNGQQAFVGLSGGFGTLNLGRMNSNALDAWGVGSVFGTALGSGYASNGNIFTRYSTAAPGSAYNTAPTRFNNAVRYTSPTFNGFSGSVLFVPKNQTTGGANSSDNTDAKTANRQGVTDIGLRYTQGALNVAYANQTITAPGTDGTVDLVSNTGATALTAGTSNKLSILSANYTIGATTLYGASWTEKQNTATSTSTTGTMMGVKYVMGNVSVLASMGNSNDKTTANVDKKVAGIGADYALSKRTNAYVRYETRDADKNSAADTSAAGQTKVTAVGLRHTF